VAARLLPLLKRLRAQVFPNQVPHADIDGQLPFAYCFTIQSWCIGLTPCLLVSFRQHCMHIADDPMNGLLPIEQAILNAGKDGSLEDIIDAACECPIACQQSCLFGAQYKSFVNARTSKYYVMHVVAVATVYTVIRCMIAKSRRCKW
jgi:hypothetical protein